MGRRRKKPNLIDVLPKKKKQKLVKLIEQIDNIQDLQNPEIIREIIGIGYNNEEWKNDLSKTLKPIVSKQRNKIRSLIKSGKNDLIESTIKSPVDNETLFKVIYDETSAEGKEIVTAIESVFERQNKIIEEIFKCFAFGCMSYEFIVTHL